MPPSITTPLLPPAAGPPTETAQDPPPLTRTQTIFIKTISLLRLLRGILLLTYPKAPLSLLLIPPSTGTFQLSSHLGVRDILIAALLLTAPTRLETSRALVLNLLSDAIDAFVLVFYSTFEKRWEGPLAVIIGTAVVAVAEHLTLWSMSEAEARGEGGRSVREVKMARMGAWLRELRQFGASRPGSGRSSVRQGVETPV